MEVIPLLELEAAACTAPALSLRDAGVVNPIRVGCLASWRQSRSTGCTVAAASAPSRQRVHPLEVSWGASDEADDPDCR